MARPVDQTLRLRLIEAATDEFAARGYAAATMAHIGDAAGVTKGGVYFHFRSKESLFFAAVDHWRGRLRAALRAARGDPASSGAARLRAYLAAHLDFHFRHPQAGRLVSVLAADLQGRFTTQLREDARQEQRALRAEIRELLAQGVRDGSLFTADTVFAAFLISGSILGVLDQWLTSPQDSEAYCHAEDLAESIVAPFATGARARGADPRRSAGDDAAAGSDLAPPF